MLVSGGWGGPPPGIDPQLYNWFVAVDQDRSGQINCVELQAALRNNNWSQFSSETCRLMISKCSEQTTIKYVLLKTKIEI